MDFAKEMLRAVGNPQTLRSVGKFALFSNTSLFGRRVPKIRELVRPFAELMKTPSSWILNGKRFPEDNFAAYTYFGRISQKYQFGWLVSSKQVGNHD